MTTSPLNSLAATCRRLGRGTVPANVIEQAVSALALALPSGSLPHQEADLIELAAWFKPKAGQSPTAEQFAALGFIADVLTEVRSHMDSVGREAAARERFVSLSADIVARREAAADAWITERDGCDQVLSLLARVAGTTNPGAAVTASATATEGWVSQAYAQREQEERDRTEREWAEAQAAEQARARAAQDAADRAAAAEAAERRERAREAAARITANIR
ncbi:hypothetical protein [Kitasatospora kazusensis]|uniref:hypothetical protein n=1 Tax=Kitasatospora kazusensis TaxID=407974 RepID=UPI0031D4C32B